MKCCVLNAQSLKSDSADFVDYVIECKPDVVAVIENWFKVVNSAARIVATPIGYKLLDHPRPNRTGGRTAIIFRESF